MLSLGIDLSGEEGNPTGLGILTEESISARTLHSNDEILEFCESKDPDILTIDAPLSFPEEK